MRPLIGLNTSLQHMDDPRKASAFCNLHYIDAVAAAGGIPVIVPPFADAEMLDVVLEKLDGFCLIGGPDYDPAAYGGHPQDPKELMPARRHTFDLLLAERLLKRAKKPVLGVCGGHQLINIAQGGKLIQDVRREWKAEDRKATTLLHSSDYRPADETEPYQHEIKIIPESRLGRIVAEKKILTNSYHHQAVDPRHIGENLMATAWAPDGIIEAIETTLEDRFVLGVQWHPEKQAGQPANKAIFDALVAACIRKDAIEKQTTAR
jgi:putative glutamine amidotransferase